MVRYLEHFYLFIRDIIKSRRIILELSKKDFRTRYLGSYLGILWAFIQPSFYILILWFIFQAGFRSSPVDKFPFILWLMVGMIPWMFFSDSLSSATNSVIDFSFLVKKMVFRVSILPIVKVLSALLIHLFFLGFVFFMFLLYGYPLHVHQIQVIYYLFSGMVLVVGLSWITSSLVIFLKDIGQVISILLQFGFWLTPVFWSTKILPLKYHFFIKLNPMYYVVEGYRGSFIYNTWFWEQGKLTIYFWFVTVCVFVIGATVFRRLRPHFADVL